MADLILGLDLRSGSVFNMMGGNEGFVQCWRLYSGCMQHWYECSHWKQTAKKGVCTLCKVSGNLHLSRSGI